MNKPRLIRAQRDSPLTNAGNVVDPDLGSAEIDH